MANGQTTAQNNLNSFVQWVATMDDDSYRQIIYRGKLSRSEIIKGCSFGTSALRQNPKIKTALAELETNLQERGVLPQLTEKAKVEQSEAKQHDRTSRKSATDARRIAQLEQEVLELKARLKRYGDLSEVLLEMGVDV
jgi:uncharacterized protein YaiL (DUF2058 family)